VSEEAFQEEGFGNATSIPFEDAEVGSGFAPKEVKDEIVPLNPGTTYHYRVVATNAYKTVIGSDRTFTTFAFGGHEFDPCENSHVRQQTGAALLLNCRAFELVSASDTAGYDVESNIVPNEVPFGGFPMAMGPSKVLYAIHQGAVPGDWNPTNLGPDPYVATRSSNGWSTQYVGLPADGMPSARPFASSFGGADATLGTFVFAGKDLCAPCFADGKTGIPVRLPDGSIVQGMAGSLDPGPGANADVLVRKRLSDDGRHFVFGSTSKFEPDGNSGDPSIYDRDLLAQTTHVVSKLPNGENIPCLSNCTSDGVAELDISRDGTRVLIGQLVSTDPEGNNYWHLYMNVGDALQSIDLMPGSTAGGLYGGMSDDGSKVYFTTTDQLASDTDSSADIYRADVSSSSSSLTRVSAGSGGSGDTDACDPALNNTRVHWNSVGAAANCDAVAIGGGGGVASSSGDIYFLSPELLDGTSGTENAPNLYVAQAGSSPHYITTLESSMDVPQPPPTGHPFVRSFGSFKSPNGIAYDPNGDYVYVLEPETFAGKVEKFDSKGHPVKFTAGSEAGGNTLTGADTPAGAFQEYEELGLANQLAVNEAAGEFFVPNLFAGSVERFSASGEYLSQVSVPFPTGVAIDQTNGNIYVSSFFGTVAVFDSSGTPLSEFSALSNLKAVAVDSTGNIYVANGTEAAMYDSSGTYVRNLEVDAATGIAVDPSDDHVYVDEGGVVRELDSSGSPASTPFGADRLEHSTGVAVDSGKVLATDASTGKVSVWNPTAVLFNVLYDSPAVLDAVNEAEMRRSGDFQVTPDGDFAVFTSKLPLTGYDNNGHAEVYRYAADADEIACASCPATGARTTGDASLAERGLSVSDDGRVFFDSTDPLIPSDLNGAEDVFEWENGEIGPISSGTSPIDSSLLSTTADGTDAYFFTRESLAPQDENGNSVKVYDARVGGGFPFDPPAPPCKASDECHGPGTQPAPPPDIGTYQGTRGNVASKNGKNGRRRKRHHRHHRRRHRKHHHKQRRNTSHRGHRNA
jgi:sugar lactone lactonase YvrE